MSFGKDPITPRRPDISTNPVGTGEYIIKQREKEQQGRFVRVDFKTLIFVRNGEDADKRISAFLDKVKNRPKMWS